MDEESYNIEILLNSFLCYYKKTFPEEKYLNFFDKIDNYSDTNKLMEHFYQCLNDYNSSRNKICIDYDKDRLDELEELYILQIEKTNVKMSDNVISLLIEVINNYDKTNWEIISE
jgi:hypothetical protein